MSDITFNRYQELAEKTAIYPKEGKIIYPTLGLAGEAGEVANKVKKLIRDEELLTKDFFIMTSEKWKVVADELGDVLWYVAALASELNMSLDTIARVNIDKLKDRKKRGKLGGSGDGR